jgi:hypothetical protein
MNTVEVKSWMKGKMIHVATDGWHHDILIPDHPNDQLSVQLRDLALGLLTELLKIAYRQGPYEEVKAALAAQTAQVALLLEE